MPKAYAGWHFTADREGCDNLIDLLSLLSRADAPHHRTIKLTDPQPVGADRIFGLTT